MSGIRTILKFDAPNSGFQTTLERRGTQRLDHLSLVSNRGQLTPDCLFQNHDLFGLIGC